VAQEVAGGGVLATAAIAVTRGVGVEADGVELMAKSREDEIGFLHTYGRRTTAAAGSVTTSSTSRGVRQSDGKQKKSVRHFLRYGSQKAA